MSPGASSEDQQILAKSAQFERKRVRRPLSDFRKALELYAGVHRITHMCTPMNGDAGERGALVAQLRLPGVDAQDSCVNSAAIFIRI